MKFLLVAFLLLLSACATETSSPSASSGPQQKQISAVGFGDLPGWSSDTVSEAIPAMRRSCAGGLGRKHDWAEACAGLASVGPSDDDARAYLTRWFQPYAVSDRGNTDGLFTGYYEAELQGSTQPGGLFQTPIYARPNDLISVDLGEFKGEWKGKHLVGKVVGQNLKPYDARGEIARGSLNGRANIIAWVNDPVGAFFLAVQGSGRIRMQDGSEIAVGYDSVNGRDYIAIGRRMQEEGYLQKPVSLQSIRAWLAAHPDQAEQAMDMNPSYEFFRVIQGDGPIGAEGVALTAGRSLAVDPSFIPLGAPLWLDTSDGQGHTLRRLMIAQDTGGAIKGVVRGDFFWGFGPEAEAAAGAMSSRGRYFLLLPKTVTANAE